MLLWREVHDRLLCDYVGGIRLQVRNTFPKLFLATGNTLITAQLAIPGDIEFPIGIFRRSQWNSVHARGCEHYSCRHRLEVAPAAPDEG